jgi:hypothetical protein
LKRNRVRPEMISSTRYTNNSSAAVKNNNNNDYIIIAKIENATEGLSYNCFNLLSNIIFPASRQNALTICDYISSMKSEINLSDHYRKDVIILLCSLSTFFKHTKPFKEITREDLLSFLGSFRKSESVDPLHKWIGTYNTYRIHLMRFFKWLYSPDIEGSKRPKPSVIQNIPQLKRKEKSIYKPTDLWSITTISYSIVDSSK